MLKTIKVLTFLMLVIMIVTPSVTAASDTNLNDLIENAMALDGKEVSVTGEALGEVLERGNYAWVNINDGTNAMGIWMTLEDAKTITFFGDYKHMGDTVRVTGIFYRACTEHGGDIDIHCNTLEVVKKGGIVKEVLTSAKIAMGTVFLFITGHIGICLL